VANKKNKYESLVKPRLYEISAWSERGLTEDEICERLGIVRSTFSLYKNKYSELSDSLKKGKDFADDQVEDSLFQKALKGDVIACIFWLKNRRPTRWRDKPGTDNAKDNGQLKELVDAIKES